MAKEFWDGFLMREKSMFVNFFYGQLKSRVQCTLCRNISITFDPYNVLSVPIPTQTTTKAISICYYPANLGEKVLSFTF